MIDYGDEKARFFRRHIAAWGKRNIREFPWRKTINPFHVLLSEMMLRRTNAPQVIEIYRDAIHKFPSAKELASATTENIISVFRPLGLMWRIQNIHEMASVLIEKFGGEVPSSYDQLKELPGVGDYVASAVCCFAYNQAMPIIDTNTVRVVGRYFGFKTHAESRRRKPVREVIKAVTSKTNARRYNYAFLDFAALVCKAIEPECPNCPLRNKCIYGQAKLRIDAERKVMKRKDEALLF